MALDDWRIIAGAKRMSTYRLLETSLDLGGLAQCSLNVILVVGRVVDAHQIILASNIREVGATEQSREVQAFTGTIISSE